MPASPQMLEYLGIRIRMTEDRKLQDKLLDIWNEYKTHATEWDAINWGFRVRWMHKELKAMDRMKICPECGRDH